MDKGIRPYAVAAFIAQSPTRINTREGNTAFRKTLMAELMEQFGITLASASTHYNHAFISAKTTHPAFVDGLGRAEDKKGGRKPKAVVVAAALAAILGDAAPVAAPAADAVVSDVETPAAAVVQGAVTLSDAGAASGLEELLATQGDVSPEAPATQKYSVCKAGDKTVVCNDLTLDEANALIAKAAKAKKSKLELVA